MANGQKRAKNRVAWIAAKNHDQKLSQPKNDLKKSRDKIFGPKITQKTLKNEQKKTRKNA